MVQLGLQTSCGPALEQDSIATVSSTQLIIPQIQSIDAQFSVLNSHYLCLTLVLLLPIQCNMEIILQTGPEEVVSSSNDA